MFTNPDEVPDKFPGAYWFRPLCHSFLGLMWRALSFHRIPPDAGDPAPTIACNFTNPIKTTEALPSDLLLSSG
jgi:hypothetical protein